MTAADVECLVCVSSLFFLFFFFNLRIVTINYESYNISGFNSLDFRVPCPKGTLLLRLICLSVRLSAGCISKTMIAGQLKIKNGVEQRLVWSSIFWCKYIVQLTVRTTNRDQQHTVSTTNLQLQLTNNNIIPGNHTQPN